MSHDTRMQMLMRARGVVAPQESKDLLLDRGVAEDSCSAARAIGYRQALEHLHRWRASPAAATPEDVVRLCTALAAKLQQKPVMGPEYGGLVGYRVPRALSPVCHSYAP